MAEYFYSCLNGNGSLEMTVKDSAGQTVWSFMHPCFYEDKATGELLEEETPMELGIIKNPSDINGVEMFLKQQGIILEADIVNKTN